MQPAPALPLITQSREQWPEKRVIYHELTKNLHVSLQVNSTEFIPCKELADQELTRVQPSHAEGSELHQGEPNASECICKIAVMKCDRPNLSSTSLHCSLVRAHCLAPWESEQELLSRKGELPLLAR